MTEEEKFKPIPISDKILVAVDYAAVESRLSAIMKIVPTTLDTGRQTKNTPWVVGTPISDTFKSDSLVHIPTLSDAEKDKRLLLSFATKYPFMRTEDLLLAGIVYFLVSFRRKRPPAKRKNKFYRKMGRLFGVNGKELKTVFEKLYPLITVQEKLFPISKFRMPPSFQQPKLRDEFNFLMKMPKGWKNEYLNQYLNRDTTSAFKEVFGLKKEQSDVNT
jgi:hypothetical protein